MFRSKFQLTLSKEHFYPSTVICLGSQLISLVNFLETKLPAHTWYSADIDAVGQTAKKYNLQSGVVKKIGTGSFLIKICAEIDQFLSGVFFAIQNDQQQKTIDVEVDTEDRLFRALDIDGILLEIRAFDTSFFDIFSENEKILKELSEKFKSHVRQNNKYTWNDLVSIKKEAPQKCRPGKLGIVCGMSRIVLEEIAKKYRSELGSWIYTVGFEDGSSIQVPENCLERRQAEQSHTELRGCQSTTKGSNSL